MRTLWEFQKNRELKELTTFGVGGPATDFIEVTDIETLSLLMQYCSQEKIRYHVLGKGSNTLFDDRGFDGLVILNKISFCKWEENLVEVGSGYSFSLLGVQSARKGFSGLEFASGIPASVGGAVYMNAGASGAETSDTLQSVTYVNNDGHIETLHRESLEFSYRHSSFQKKTGVIAAASFRLAEGAGARSKQLQIIEYRTKTQPYGEKSAGCVFRNPPNQAAARLIQECSLKGIQVGGAEVSSMHANFIINKASAKTGDILALAKLVRQKVLEQTGIELEMEIRAIPYQEADV